jgi:F0F1-type ATP synthase membrane subunit c/vacuolar-type H+-ATPase subunit K
MIDIRQAKLAYLVSAIGVALTASAAVIGMTRTMVAPEERFGGNRQFSNMTVGNATAIANMAPRNMNTFGLTDTLAIVGVIIAVVGLAWLGLTLLKLKKMQPPNTERQSTE